MILKFRLMHLAARLPENNGRGIELKASCIVDKGDVKIHSYGVGVSIPEGHIGLLMPMESCSERQDRMGYIGVITPEDKNMIRATFNICMDDMINSQYQEGEVSARLIVIPVVECVPDFVTEF